MMRRLMVVVVLLFGASIASAAAPASEHISHGRFKDVALYRPAGKTQQFVLLLSGAGGWSASLDAAARALTGEGAMVAGIDIAQLRAALHQDGSDCAFPDGDLENLSHYLQGYARVPTYLVPIVIGDGEGASLAYALLAKSAPDVFAAAISLDFCPQLDLHKPLCQGGNLHFIGRARSTGVDLQPGELAAPWVVLDAGHSCRTDVVRDFVGRVSGGAMARLPALPVAQHVLPRRLPQLLAAYRALASQHHAALPPPPASLSDLPLIEVPAAGGSDDSGDSFAILLSGDGGWAGLDKNVAGALAAKGIPVVGFDSLRYFWRKRTPAGLATDLDRVIRYYAAHWHKAHVRLLGYSQGADVLPFAVNRLPPASRALVAQTVLMGLGDNASFEFHLTNWMSDDDDEGLPILPEAGKLAASTTLCVYGDDDEDSLCPKIPPGHVTPRRLPGGHHFDGAYDKLAQIILAGTGQR